jgi:hypothetical protein
MPPMRDDWEDEEEGMELSLNVEDSTFILANH